MDYQMPYSVETRPPVYHHFVLLVWEERDAEGTHVTWRFSLQDSQKEARMGFKNLEELTAFLEGWMKSSSEDNSEVSSLEEKRNEA
jgi:hypothetical protein